MNLNYPGGTDIFIRQVGSLIIYSTNQVNWSLFTFPATITNNDTGAGLVTIQFISDITLSTVNDYFICGSNFIQFGSVSLKDNGSRPIINIPIDNYDGFIENGTETVPGYDNIYIYNLYIEATFRVTQIGGGWVGKKGFGNSATNNYIVNCSSSGDLPVGAAGSGGIVGSYAGKGFGATLYLLFCSSSGQIPQFCGGIVGSFAGFDGGSVVCEQCWSTGLIGLFAGGIYGYFAGFNGSAEAIKCYTSGSNGSSGGGIFGSNAGAAGSAIANRCYSQGAVGTNSGGIFGITAGSSSGATIASNCYTSGNITTSGNGIYGTGKENGSEINCYIGNGSWNSVSANSQLQGVPNPVVGSTWVSPGVNQPYELNNMGYSPYSINNITVTAGVPSLNNQSSEILSPGQDSAAAIISGLSYEILGISVGGIFDAYPSISIDSSTGVITVGENTEPNDYLVYVRNTGSYYITSFSLSVSSPPSPIPCFVEGTKILTPSGYLDVAQLTTGSAVLTSDGREVRVQNVFKRSITPDNHTCPCVVGKDTIEQGVPLSEFRISQNHLLYWKGYWLLPKMWFPLDKMQGQVKYVHIQLENYRTDHLVLENGIVAESFGVSYEDSLEYSKRVNQTLEMIHSLRDHIVIDKK